MKEAPYVAVTTAYWVQVYIHLTTAWLWAVYTVMSNVIHNGWQKKKAQVIIWLEC